MNPLDLRLKCPNPYGREQFSMSGQKAPSRSVCGALRASGEREPLDLLAIDSNIILEWLARLRYTPSTA